jgi:hypothetical protein
MAEGGLFDHLTDEEKKALGLDKKKARWWIVNPGDKMDSRNGWVI